MKISQGFTLIEMSIVLLIIGFLIGGMFVPLSMQMNQQRIKDTQKTLETIKEALMGFAIINNHLPCPALDQSGIGKNPPCDSNKEGEIPWAVLGIDRYDSSGYPIRYRLDDAYGAISFPVSLDTSSELKIRDINNNHLTNETGNSNVIAVIYSCGTNGKPDNENNKYSYLGANCSLPFSATGDTYTQDFYVENKFDDILVWLPKTLLINQLVLAGKWPP